MGWKLWAFTAGVGVGLLACEARDRRAAESGKPADSEPKREVDRAADDLRRAKDSFVEGAQRRLDDAVRRAGELGDKASAELGEKRRQTEKFLRDARDQVGSNWDQAKRDIDRAIADLDAEIDRLRQEAAARTDAGTPP